MQLKTFGLCTKPCCPACAGDTPDNEVLQDETIFELEFGPTFWMSVAGLVLAVIVSCNLFANAKHAEDGPFYGGTCGVKDGEGNRHGNV